jgi:hypothetical protein
MRRSLLFATTMLAALALAGCVVPCPTSEPCTYLVAAPVTVAPVIPCCYAPAPVFVPAPVFIAPGVVIHPRWRRW